MKVNRSMKHSLTMTLAVLVSVGVAMTVWGVGDYEESRRSLAGRRGVHVKVEDISPDAERDGLTATGLQTDVELRLRLAGIRVLTEAESLAMPDNALLYLNVTTLKRGGRYSYTINLTLSQRVRLERDLSIQRVPGTTWIATGTIGTVGVNKLGTVRKAVRDMVDQFINAYLAANPKR